MLHAISGRKELKGRVLNNSLLQELTRHIQVKNAQPLATDKSIYTTGPEIERRTRFRILTGYTNISFDLERKEKIWPK